MLHPLLQWRLDRAGCDEQTVPSPTQWAALLADLNASFLAHDGQHPASPTAALADLPAADTLRIMADHLPAATYLKDTAGRFVQLNQQQARNLGIAAPADALGKTDDDFFDRDHAEAAWADEQRVMASGEALIDQLEHYVDPAGRPVWIMTSKVPVRGADGTIIGTAGISSDVTDRRQMQAALRESEERFRATFNQAAVGLAHVSLDGHWLLVNQRLCDITGYAKEAIQTTVLSELVHLDEREQLMARFRCIGAGRLDSDAGEYRLIRGDGREVWVTLTASLARDSDGSPKYFIVALEDSSERKRAAEALRENELRYRVLFASAERQARELALLDEVRTVLARELDPRTVFRTVVEAIAQTFGYTMVSLYLIEAEHLVLQHQVGYHQVIETIPLERGVSGRVARTGQPALIQGHDSDPAALWAFEGIASEVCVPLCDDGRVVGILNLESTGEVPLDDADLRLMMALSEHVSMAIARTRLYREARDSEQRYRAVVDHVNEVIFQTDAAGRWTFLSPAWAEITGWSVEEALGQDFRRFVHPDDRISRIVEFKPLRDGSPASSGHQLRLLTKAGGFRWVEVFAWQTLDEAQQVGGAAGTLKDITERRQAEEQLRYRVDFETIITTISTNFINLAHHEIDAAINDALQTIGTFADVDRSYLFRFSDDGTEMSNTHEWCAPDIAPQMETLQKIPSMALPWWTSQVMQQHAILLSDLDDLPMDAEAERTLLADQEIKGLVVVPLVYNRCVIGFMGFDSVRQTKQWTEDSIRLLSIVGQIFVNTLQRKRNEEALVAAETRFRHIVESLGEGLILTDLDDRLTYVNSRMVELFGYQPEEMIGKRSWELFVPEADWPAMYARNDRRAHGISEQYEQEARRKDGTMIWALVNAAPLRDSSGTVIGTVGAVTDITERRRTEEELREAIKAAESANRAKSAFLANMSHELRTPLNAILGYSEMLQEDAEEQGNSALSSDLGRIHKAGLHLLRLINDILDLSKIEAGKIELYLEPFVVTSFVEEVVTTVRPLVERNGNRLVLDCAPRLGLMQSDITRVRQVLLNLLSNAGRFTSDGMVKLTVSREAREGTDWICFSVEDTGIGISPEQQALLFREFTQADASTTRQYGGTGLGLALSQRLCTLLGGTITVDSTLHVGSTFTVLLPAGVVGAPTMVSQTLEARQGGRSTRGAPDQVPAQRKLTVLVVDDDAAAAELIVRHLTRHGLRVETASSGAEGLRRAHELRPDVITLDVVLPDLDGWAVLTALKATPPLASIPVLMLTIADDEGRASALGATGYLTKPVDRERLAALVERWGRQPPTRGEVRVYES